MRKIQLTPILDYIKRSLTEQERDNLVWFWRNYLRSKVGWVILVIVMMALQGIVYQQFLQYTEEGLRVIFENGARGDLFLICAAVIGMFMFRGVLSFLIPRIAASVTWSAINTLRRNITAHMVRLELNYFEARQGGEIMQTIAGFTRTFGEFIVGSLIRSVRDVFTIVIISGWLLWQQPLLFLSSAICIPLLLMSVGALSRRIKPLQSEQNTLNSDYLSAIDELVSGIRTVKITNQEGAEEARVSSVADRLSKNAVRAATIQALTMPALDFTYAVVYALVIGIGGFMVLSPIFAIDGASIITFLVGLVVIFDPGRRLTGFFVQAQANLVTLQTLRNVFYENIEEAAVSGPVVDFDTSGDIQFVDLHFQYAPDRPLFNGINLTFAGGKTTAIVGPTGSGKTSILSLLARLYLPHSGAITIAGQDISELNLMALRDSLAVVAQDIVIFNSSIYDNIAYVRPDATREQIEGAAEAAELLDLMRQRGATPVGPKGSQLSGGQKQRIAIARAILRDAPIVLLDEATSALDQNTEERVQKAIKRLTKGKTTIVVAHRLSSVVNAHCIHLLENGTLSETGTHKSLMKQEGLYAKLFDAQRKSFHSSEAPESAGEGS